MTQPITINKGVRQGCPLLLTLLNVRVNQIVTEWKEGERKGIKISRNKCFKTLLFPDNQVTVQSS